MSKYVGIYDSPVGTLRIISDGKALNALLLPGEETDAAGGAKATPEAEEIFSLARAWLDEYFAGKKCENPKLFSEKKEGNKVEKSYIIKVGENTFLLKPEGTDFRQEVWKILCEIPYGETVTYGDIAQQMAKLRGKKKMSAQAVGGAVGRNPIALMIPCHRVIGTNGNLVGYGGGLPMKRKLLQLEGIETREERQ